MSSIHNSDFWDKRISWYIVLFFIVQSLNTMIKTSLPIPENLWGKISLGFGLISLFYLVFSCLDEVIRRTGKLLFRVVALFLILYTFSITYAGFRREPINVLLSFSALWCFSWWIPVGICAASIRNYKILYFVFVKSSYILLAILLICFMDRNNLDTNKEYSMGFGFQIILPTLIHISEFYLKRKWYFLVLILAELAMILLYANRGVLLSVASFVLFLFLFGNLSVKRKLLLVTLVGAAAAVFVSKGETILYGVVSMLDTQEINSRTLTMMMEHNMEYSTGRDVIWKHCGEMIMDKPVLGWGLGGEYCHLSRLLGNIDGEAIVGTHNMLIQFFVEFGVFVGFVLCLTIIIPLFKLHKIKDTYKLLILTVCYSATIIPCLISSSEPMQKPAIAIFIFIYYKRVFGVANQTQIVQQEQIINH